jgi:hypothetical protein
MRVRLSVCCPHVACSCATPHPLCADAIVQWAHELLDERSAAAPYTAGLA